MTEHGALRTELAQACRVLARLNLTKGTLGHVSVRLPESNTLLIRARGASELGVAFTTEDQIIEVDLDGRLVRSPAEGLAVPLEIFIHTALYRRREDVVSVAHLHPSAAVLCTACETPLLPIYGAYDPFSAKLAIEGVPTYPRSTLIDTPALGDALADAMGDARVCLMRGHGVTTAGPSIVDASLNAIYLNDLATMNQQARMLGDPQPISQEDQAIIAGLENPEPGARFPSPRSLALWRYYCADTQA